MRRVTLPVAPDGIVVQKEDLPHFLAGKTLGQHEHGLYPIGQTTVPALPVLPFQFRYFPIGQFHTVKFGNAREQGNIIRSNAKRSDQLHAHISDFNLEGV